MRNHIICILYFSMCNLGAQNLILNPSFENYSSCPVSLGQAHKVINWRGLLPTCDYYNCAFLNDPAYPTGAGAYSGTGCMGFAGSGNNYCEAIGQNLAQPLIAGNHYSLSIGAKKVYMGMYSQVCGGIEVYGLKDSLPTNLSLIHASQIPNVKYLGSTSNIQNNNWQMFSININPLDTIYSVIFTVSNSQNCKQGVFVDSLNLVKFIPTKTQLLNFEMELSIFPNPIKDHINLYINFAYPLENCKLSIKNIYGIEVLNCEVKQNLTLIDLHYLSSGVYFADILKYGISVKKHKIIKQ